MIITRRLVRSVAVATLGLLAGCGEAADERPDEATSGSASPSYADPAARVDSFTTTPELLAAACLRGEPSLGVPWSVDSVRAIALPIIAIEQLEMRDSAQLAARIARVVDVLPNDTSVADFRGLPVVVRAAWRLALAERDTVVVALVTRRVPIQSEPLEETHLIVTAPGQRQGANVPLVAGWIVRDVASEETVAARELLAAFGDATSPELLLLHEGADGVRAEIVARTAGKWQRTWSGTMPACPER